MRRFSWLLTVSIVAACSTPAADDDVVEDDTEADDDTVTDDDLSPPADICDDHPGEIGCEGWDAITCDAQGDIDATEACNEVADFYCEPGIGCVLCVPGERWCEGAEVKECGADGLTATIVETCDEAAGDVCDDGDCLTLCDLAQLQLSSVGCRFFSVDMEQSGEENAEHYPTRSGSTEPYDITKKM